MTVDALPPSQSRGWLRTWVNVRKLVDPAVRLEEIHPGEHSHHVADPEGKDDQDENDALPPPRVPGRVVGDRIPDQQAEGQGDEDVDDRPDPDVEPDPSRREAAEDLVEPADVPVERVPDRDRLEEDRVDRSERDPEDRVERNDEEENEPENARERKSWATTSAGTRRPTARAPWPVSCRLRRGSPSSRPATAAVPET